MLKTTKKTNNKRRPGKKLSWYVYAIECENASVYIGQTSDLQKRWEQHLKGQGARWTKKYKPVRLFYTEKCSSYLAVRKRERELKKTKGRNSLKKILKELNFQVNISAGNFNQGGKSMAGAKSDLLTAGNIAKELAVPGAKVKKAIQQLGLKPAAKKGVCNYYSQDALPKIKAALK